MSSPPAEVKTEEFSCSLCEFCALTEVDLEAHIDVIHFEIFSIECCEQDLKTENTELVFNDVTKSSVGAKNSEKRKLRNKSGID